MKHLQIGGIFMLTVQICNSQDLELLGTYSASFIGSESITFVGKDSFYFSGFYCTYGVKGKGVCEIIDNNLYLYFEEAKQKYPKENTKPPLIIPVGDADSFVNIQVECVDRYESAIYYATLEIVSGGIVIGSYATDSIGRVGFAMAADRFPIMIKSSAFGMETDTVKIDSVADYSVKIFHRDSEFANRRINNGQVYVYEIQRAHRDLIIMRREGTRGFYEYKKSKTSSFHNP